jgi:hypothetical protein
MSTESMMAAESKMAAKTFFAIKISKTKILPKKILQYFFDQK